MISRHTLHRLTTLAVLILGTGVMPSAPATQQEQPALATASAEYVSVAVERVFDGTVEAVHQATVSAQTPMTPPKAGKVEIFPLKDVKPGVQATAWTVFWRVKFPLILPTVGIVTILTFVGNFNAFDLIYTIKGALAGPNFSTDIMGTMFFRAFFGQQLQLGNASMGSTVAAMMLIIILIGVLVYLVGWQRRIHTYEI